MKLYYVYVYVYIYIIILYSISIDECRYRGHTPPTSTMRIPTLFNIMFVGMTRSD